MAIQTTAWEYRLLAWAHEGLASQAPDRRVVIDQRALDYAYRYCAGITRAHSHTFYLASTLLPPDKRRAVQAMYAFCRSTDDLVDIAGNQTSPATAFAMWRERLIHHPSANDPVPLAWRDVQAHYGIPRGYADQLIEGISRDLRQNRYASFAELTEYCYGVASTVGLMTMHIVGFRGEEALPYAIKLGIALQLTNILRDVGEDWREGRLYLPLAELREFGLCEMDIAAGRINDNWRAFMRFQIERTRRLYDEAQPGIKMLSSEGRFAIAAAAQLYRAILEDIEANDYDVFHRRAHLGAWNKIKRLPAIWWATGR